MKPDVTRTDRLCRLFCTVLDRIISARALRETKGNSLSPAQFAGLQFIYLHPNACIKELAQGLSVSHPAAVKLVERLEAKGLIARSPHKTDRRMVQLSVTRSGARQASAVIRARSRAIEKLLAAAGEECSCNLMACLEAFIKAAVAEERDRNGVCLHCGTNHDPDCPACQVEEELGTSDQPACHSKTVKPTP
jgi:DNA-binding MarR family transcriptional regulator